jgi:hypothetical protein
VVLGLAAVLLAAALPAPASASAPSPTYAETRVWGFDLEIPAGVGVERGSSPTGTGAYGSRYDELAVGYPLVPRGAPDSLNITGKQFSKKLNRRANELGLDVSSAKDRFKFRSRIQRAFDNAEEVRSGTFRGQGPGGAEGPVNFFRRGEDVVVTTPDGDFVTFLPGGASNKRFLAGTPIP